MANVPIRDSSLEERYPSNAHVDREEPKPEIKRVATGRVKKKTVGHKMTEAFVGEDVENVGSYILYDVLVPALKSMLSDMVSGGIEMLLFGEKGGRSRANTMRSGSKTYVNYGVYSDQQPERRQVSNTQRSRHNFDDIIFDTRGEAEEVLGAMVDLCTDYHSAAVSDLFEMAGVNSTFTDNKWGWTDLRGAYTDRVRGGYILRLPKPEMLD